VSPKAVKNKKKTRKQLRQEQCNAMRKKLRSGAVNSASHSNTGELLHHSPEGPTLRSSMPYKKIKNGNQKYVVNMDILTTSLRECQHYRKGPLVLCNICEDVRAEGVCPVLKVRCCHCTVRESTSYVQGSTIALAKEDLQPLT